MTTVINMRNAPLGWESDPQFAYIGRPGKGWTAETAPFGKPRTIDGTKPDWPVLYRAYLNRELQTNEAFAIRVAALRGKTLICFCKPKPCHGDTLIKAIEWLSTPEGKAWFLTRFPPKPQPPVFEDVEDPAYWGVSPERS